MKRINLFIAISAFLIWFGCTNEDAEPSKDKLIGSWIEKYPEKFDRISDTIVFGEDSIVRKYIIFKDCKYSVQGDTIAFQKLGRIWQFHFEYINTNEIIIYNFMDRSITAQIKDINYIKID